ncbi:MAG: glycosyltransferase family 2 protein [Bdellovibrionales bacterium]|nr:glycosyltransferase family 2 protein [Bdellovibrionales bacterium]
MINGKTIAVVLPAYNAEQSLKQTFDEIPKDVIDIVLLVDDCSSDQTVEVAKSLGIATIRHEQNKGYGGNQKTCYREAIRRGADIVVMLHPDYQYSPKLLTPISAMLAYGEYDVALGSRILAQSATKRGMPYYKYFSNRVLTFLQNIALESKLSEFHTGYRAFTRQVLETLPLEENSDDFVFDNEMLAQIIWFNFRIGEVSCPTRYAAESSSISFKRSVVYGLGVLRVSASYLLQKYCSMQFSIFSAEGKKLTK